MENIRRSDLVAATIAEIAETGSLDVTMRQIAKRAGVSSALAHHYFGTKEQIFLSSMRHVLALFGAEVQLLLAKSDTPRERVEAIIRASFAESNFRQEIISAWLSFYVQAQRSEAAARLLNIYRGRLRSNLVYGLRPLVNDHAEQAAEGIAAMIDGIYVRQSLSRSSPDPAYMAELVIDYLDRICEQRT
jgi:TetR/AcrR family transcriptional repressor of bet genes